MAAIQAHRQEGLAFAYVQAVAAAAGITCSVRNQDYGIDITLYEVWQLGNHYFESDQPLNLQLKTTTRAVADSQQFKYDLDVKTYDYLRQPVFRVPRILAVLALPPVEQHWLGERREGLTIRGCMYWISLAKFKPTNNRRSVRVSIPVNQRFTVSGLRNIFHQIRRRRPL